MKYQLSPDIVALNQDVLGGEEKVEVRTELGGYRSLLEKRAAETWVPLVFEWFKYEEVSVRIPGGAWYKPDFFGLLRTGKLAFVEAKGYTKTLRADKLRYNAAREIHFWVSWCWLTIEEGQWRERWDEKV